MLPIPSSNLILFVAENLCPVDDQYIQVTTTPYEHGYSNESLACHRSTVTLRRRRPSSCINRHVNVRYTSNTISCYNYKPILFAMSSLVKCSYKSNMSPSRIDEPVRETFYLFQHFVWFVFWEDANYEQNASNTLIYIYRRVLSIIAAEHMIHQAM